MADDIRSDDHLLERTDAPEGFRWEWTTEETVAEWQVGNREGRLCRRLIGGHARCPNVAVAALNRGRYTRQGRVDSWWFYCVHHLYGRRLRDGELEHPRLVRG